MNFVALALAFLYANEVMSYPSFSEDVTLYVQASCFICGAVFSGPFRREELQGSSYKSFLSFSYRLACFHNVTGCLNVTKVSSRLHNTRKHTVYVVTAEST